MCLCCIIYVGIYRYEQYKRTREAIDKYEGGLEQFSRGYEKLGFTRRYITPLNIVGVVYFNESSDEKFSDGYRVISLLISSPYFCMTSETGITYMEWAPGAKVSYSCDV